MWIYYIHKTSQYRAKHRFKEGNGNMQKGE